MNEIKEMKVTARGGISLSPRFDLEGNVIPSVYEVRNKGHEVAVLDFSRPFGVEVRVPNYADHSRDKVARVFGHKIEATGFVDVDTADGRVSTYHDPDIRHEARATFWIEYGRHDARIHIQTADKADLRIRLSIA